MKRATMIYGNRIDVEVEELSKEYIAVNLSIWDGDTQLWTSKSRTLRPGESLSVRDIEVGIEVVFEGWGLPDSGTLSPAMQNKILSALEDHVSMQ